MHTFDESTWDMTLLTLISAHQKIQTPVAHLGATGLHVGDDATVVPLVAGDQVLALQHQAYHRRVRLELHVRAGVIPVEVFLQVLVHGRRQRVPDAHVREELRLRELEVGALQRGHVRLRAALWGSGGD